MNDRIQGLVMQIRLLEAELLQEMQKKQREFLYEIRKKRVLFQQEVALRHKQLKTTIHRYLIESSIPNMLTIPIIWSVAIPALLIDAVITFYQWTCFPIYGIPRVKRSDYIVMDRRYLKYLNFIERINCAYCEYFNGLVSYIEEIAARTEQYWCPIKHARKLKNMHSRYGKFLDYGDAESYKARIEEVRRDFKDLE